MPLPMPKLDNRTFKELAAEGRSLIPRHAPGWTDHNVHDPGITLIELFAWLTEMNIYRLDRTQAASYRAFLRLVGIELRPAQIAETVLVVSLEPANDPILLPAGLQVGDASGAVAFQTQHDVHVSPAQLVAVFTGDEKNWVERTIENQTPNRLYPPFGSRPKPDSALYLGFDHPLADQPVELSLYVWIGSIPADREMREQLIAEWEAARAEAAVSCSPGMEPDGPGWWQHYSTRTVWEYFTSAGAWASLPGVIDETRGLTLSGPVRFTAPTDQAPSGPDSQLSFIRCRFVSGRYECPPEIDMVALNAVLAHHAADAEAEALLGLSNGWAGQVFQLSDGPIVPGSTRLTVLSNNVEDEPWHEVLLWDLVGPHDRAYCLSPERGEIIFGDGYTGRVPPARAEIRATYQVGGGPAGNVAAGCLTKVVNQPYNASLVPDWETVLPTVHVIQPFPATGGTPAETLPEAQSRALNALAEQYRAVTLADLEALALATPGAPVARAYALPDYHPALPCFPAPGNVTVVVVPRCPDPHPEPGPDLLQAVARYLGRRLTLTTEMHVVGPCYTPVTVHARLHIEPTSDARSLRAQARTALDKFFHPLDGGPDGEGWPVGRDVYRTEVVALLSALPGVNYVDQLGLETEGDPEPRCGNLPICPNCLVASGQHRIRVIERNMLR